MCPGGKLPEWSNPVRRDFLAHVYFGVNLKRAWKVAREDIFATRAQILRVKEDLAQE